MTTADTGACGPVLVGRGCGASPTETTTQCSPPSGDTGVVEPPTDGVVVGGGPGGCATPSLAPGTLGVWVVLAVLWRLRRLAWLVVGLVSVAATGDALAQVDAQRLQIDDGGAFPALWDADLGKPFHGAGTVSLNTARNLAVLDFPDGSEQVLLDRVQTWQAQLSWNLFGAARVGTTVPVHQVTFSEEPLNGVRLGDWAFWLSIPTNARPGKPPASWTVRVNVPTGPEQLLLGGPGSVTGLFATEYRAGPLRGIVNVGAELQVPTPIPGTQWGSSVLYGAGLRAQPWGPVWITAEAEGSLPLRFREARATHFPLEGLLSAGVDLPPVLSVGAGVGTGFTRGLGSPSLRVAAFVDVRPRPRSDIDNDGIPDPRDQCVEEPEDRDLFRDRDGCPDPDNDQDGMLDGVDGCPNVAEIVNGYLDADGCPDQITEITVELVPVENLGAAGVQFADGARVVAPPSQPVRNTVGGDETTITVDAWGFHTHRERLPLDGTPVVRRIELRPLPFSTLRLSVTSASGQPINATVQTDSGPPEPASEPMRLPVGTHDLTLSAPDHLPRVLSVPVPATRDVEITVVLERNPIEVDGSHLRTPQRIHFPLDEATVEPESLPVVDALAAWMRAHPEVELLRIEGHADASGTSRYNYALSLARAQAIRDALVERGIPTERLLAIGSGEARSTDDRDTQRRVEFLVLVWDR